MFCLIVLINYFVMLRKLFIILERGIRFKVIGKKSKAFLQASIYKFNYKVYIINLNEILYLK